MEPLGCVQKQRIEVSIRYRQYLKSTHWQQLRRRILARDHYTCTDCGATEVLQVHHLCYRPFLEDALDSDLVTLCKGCHELRHRKPVWVKKAKVSFGHLDEKRRSLMDGFTLPTPSRSWLVRRLMGWLQN
jgi:5-methylcytosine-specific restriction endonuclease McrA